LSNKNRFSDSSAKSYSQALYELASEEKNLNDVEKHVISLLKLISQSEDFNLLIQDPTNKQEDQLNVINIIFEKFNLNNLLKKFLNFLVTKRRLFYVEKILKDFLSEYEKMTKITKEFLEKIVNRLIDKHKTNFKGIGQPLRVALTGSKYGPGLYNIILSLDKNEIIKRLEMIK